MAIRFLTIAIFCLLVFHIGPVCASEHGSGKNGSSHIGSSNSDLPVWMHEHLEPSRTLIGDWVDTTSRHIDAFFGTPDSRRVENRSYLRLSQRLQWGGQESLGLDIDLKYRLDLPTARRRLRLIIKNTSDTYFNNRHADSNHHLDDTPGQESSSVLGLNWLNRGDRHSPWQQGVEGGIRLDTPLNPYLQLTRERDFLTPSPSLNHEREAGSAENSTGSATPWQLDVKLSLGWFNATGTGAEGRWNLHRTFGRHRRLSLVAQLGWQEKRDKLKASQVVRFDQTLNARTALRHTLVAVGESASDPSLEYASLSSRLRRDLHKGVVFGDIIPEWQMVDTGAWEAEPRLTLRLEIYFQKQLRRDHF